MGRVQNKACVVTGAGSGIGKATALRLAEEGGKVVVSDINLDSAKKVTEEINSAGGIAVSVAADVSDDKQAQNLIDVCVKEFGTVHVVVNSAGVNIPGVFHEVKNEIIDKILNNSPEGYVSEPSINHAMERVFGSIVYLENQSIIIP